MSWGERSCKKCKAPEGYCSIETCNVDCKWYEWDGVTRPDSINSKEPRLVVQNSGGLNRKQRRALKSKRRT